MKAELGMKTKKEDEEDDTKCCSLKAPIDPSGNDLKTYIVKIQNKTQALQKSFLSGG
jgi:hypothetical protein